MQRRRSLHCMLLAAFMLVSTLPAGAQPLPPQPTVKLQAGMHVITAEFVDNDFARARGLMFRQSLAPNSGMLFKFAYTGIQCMWMRNTLIPLSVAFLDDDGTIVNIEDMEPGSEKSHCAKRPVRFALEMTVGWFKQKGIAAGAKLNGIPK